MHCAGLESAEASTSAGENTVVADREFGFLKALSTIAARHGGRGVAEAGGLDDVGGGTVAGQEASVPHGLDPLNREHSMKPLNCVRAANGRRS